MNQLVLSKITYDVAKGDYGQGSLSTRNFGTRYKAMDMASEDNVTDPEVALANFSPYILTDDVAIEL